MYTLLKHEFKQKYNFINLTNVIVTLLCGFTFTYIC